MTEVSGDADIQLEGGSQYDMMKVAQLRMICKQRGLSVEGKKEELVGRLVQSDEAGGTEGEVKPVIVPVEQTEFLTTDELRELATIADEMRHIRRQWVRFY